jgi:hypothetical protein
METGVVRDEVTGGWKRRQPRRFPVGGYVIAGLFAMKPKSPGSNDAQLARMRLIEGQCNGPLMLSYHEKLWVAVTRRRQKRRAGLSRERRWLVMGSEFGADREGERANVWLSRLCRAKTNGLEELLPYRLFTATSEDETHETS